MAPPRKFDWEEARSLHFERGLSFAEIGRQLGVGRDAVQRACNPRARARAHASALATMRRKRKAGDYRHHDLEVCPGLTRRVATAASVDGAPAVTNALSSRGASCSGPSPTGASRGRSTWTRPKGCCKPAQHRIGTRRGSRRSTTSIRQAPTCGRLSYPTDDGADETELDQEGVAAAAALEAVACGLARRRRVSRSDEAAAAVNEELSGTVFGDRFGAFRGGSGLFEEGARQAEEVSQIAGKAC